MNRKQELTAFVRLGEILHDVANGNGDAAWETAVRKAGHQNGWFTDENIRLALRGISYMLRIEKLESWLASYPESTMKNDPKRVGIIMAGNIPLVGFHDLLTVLISGHHAIVKTSSQDDVLPRALVETLIGMEPLLSERIIFSDGRMHGFTHIIATGSSNSSRYFEYYFNRYPSVIRGNRNSVAIITGKETDEELHALGKDIFRFFGLGCRNVSKLYVHESVVMPDILQHLEGWKHISQHNKYHNNYEYHKAILLVEKLPHLDTGFLLLKEDDALTCPVSMVHYSRFSTLEEIQQEINTHSDAIQCVVASAHLGIVNSVPFGKSQQPEVWDYADGVDTMAFLLETESIGM